ncbi:hypothetical protein HKX48_004471 [Thoreauomyces humboldtii]|nr:hypothetical protein HKX48_004471 [Thoreauomyces humboldtii]
MQASAVHSIVDDAHFEVLFPATDSLDVDAILKAPARTGAFYDEVLRGYLVFRPSTAASATRVTPAMLVDIATQGLDVHVIATVTEVEALTTASGTGTPVLTAPVSALTVAPPPMAHHLGSSSITAPNRSRAATTGHAPGLSKQGGPAVSTNAGYLASPTVQRRTTSLKTKPPRPLQQPVLENLRKGQIAGYGGRSPMSAQYSHMDRAHLRDQEIIYSATQAYTEAPAGTITFAVDALAIVIPPGLNAALFPFSFPIGIVKPKEADVSYRLEVIVSLTARSTRSKPEGGTAAMCDPDDFDSPNLLAGLAHDPYFNPAHLPSHYLPHHSRKHSIANPNMSPRIIQRSLPLEPLLSVHVTTVNIGPRQLALSIVVEHAPALTEAAVYNLEHVAVELAHALVRPVSPALWTGEPLHQKESLHLLFTITLLDPPPPSSAALPISPPSAYSSISSLGSISQTRDLLIKIKGKCSLVPGLSAQTISASWVMDLDGTERHVEPDYGTRPHGVHERTAAASATDAAGGLTLAFSVAGPVTLRKMFTVQMVIVNCSSETYFLTVVIPTTANMTAANGIAAVRSPPIPRVSATSTDDNPKNSLDLNMSDQVFMTTYSALEKHKAAVVCLENNIELGPLRPAACETVNLHFVAIKGRHVLIDRLQLVDRRTGKVVDVNDSETPDTIMGTAPIRLNYSYTIDPDEDGFTFWLPSRVFKIQIRGLGTFRVQFVRTKYSPKKAQHLQRINMDTLGELSEVFGTAENTSQIRDLPASAALGSIRSDVARKVAASSETPPNSNGMRIVPLSTPSEIGSQIINQLSGNFSSAPELPVMEEAPALSSVRAIPISSTHRIGDDVLDILTVSFASPPQGGSLTGRIVGGTKPKKPLPDDYGIDEWGFGKLLNSASESEDQDEDVSRPKRCGEIRKPQTVGSHRRTHRASDRDRRQSEHGSVDSSDLEDDVEQFPNGTMRPASESGQNSQEGPKADGAQSIAWTLPQALQPQAPRKTNDFVDEEAAEWDDEFFGEGGADGDFNDENAMAADLTDLVVSDAELDGPTGRARVDELHRKQGEASRRRCHQEAHRRRHDGQSHEAKG